MSKEQNNNVFMSVVENHKGIIYKIANSYCADYEDRKDLIQEILIQLWKSFDKYNSQFKYSTWIYRIALNVAISCYRKENSRKTISESFEQGFLYLSETTISDEKEKNLNALHQFISELKELDKALMLLFLDEKSHKEMAEILGISETNVATKISRIKIKIKERFSQIKNQ